MKTAITGIYVMLLLLVVNVVTVEIVAPNGGIVVEDVLIGAGFLAIAVGISRRALWSRYAGIAVAGVFAIGALSQFQSGVPGVVIGAGIVQIVVLVGVAVMLLLPATGDWYRGLY